MQKLVKLPDTEFEIMQIVWDNPSPINTKTISEALKERKDWKMPTVISFLNRLVDKGFLRTEKKGKERSYFPLVEKADYLEFETKSFVKCYHHNSLSSLVNTFYGGRKLTNEEIQELEQIIYGRGVENE